MDAPADLGRLRQFASEVPGGMEELVAQFLRHVTATVAELQQAADRGDVTAARQLAHRSAGATGVCGAQRLMELLRQVEGLAKEGRADAVAPAVTEAVAELERVRLYLTDVVNQERSQT